MINFFKKNFAKGKKSLRICHPELAAPLVADVKEAYKGGGSQSISGSYHLQEYTDFNINKSNVGVETPTYNNISLNTKECSIIWQCLRPHSPRRAAFTLAEVLITLGIIGIVAAMTLPTLIQNYKVKQIVTQLKTNYSIFNTAFRMAIAQNGEISSWGLSELSYTQDEDTGDHNYVNDSNINSSKILFNAIKPYLKIAKICEPGDSSCIIIKEGKNNGIFEFYSGILTNGTSFYLFSRSGNCEYENVSINTRGKLCGDLTIDINGPDSKPNEWGKDIFRFSIVPEGIIPRGAANDKIFPFKTFCRPDMKQNISNYWEGCTAWIIYNENMDYEKCSDLDWDGKHKCN